MTLEDSIKALEDEWREKVKKGIPVDLDMFKRRKRALLLGIKYRDEQKEFKRRT